VHVANLNEVKDQTTLLRAFRRVVDRLGDVRLDCAGEDALRGEIQAGAIELGLGDRVTFHGFLPQQQLAELYRRAHLNVLSSRHESQAVVVLEAASAGLPTVGTRVGLLDTLSPGAASAVPVGDAAALADAITALLADDAAREAMGAAAQAFARAHDVRWTAAAFEAIYERI
jgi:glycosyltransferase involved in cell wall biosynthesis